MDRLMKMRVCKTSLMARTASVAVLSACAAFASAEAKEYKAWLDIPAQSLEAALKEFGVETDSQVLFAKDVVAGRTSVPVKGVFTPREALALLTRDTGLRIDQSAESVFLIKSATAAAAAAPQTTAQAPTTSQTSDTAQDQPKEDSNKAADENRKVERVVVTGTHIRGKHPKSSPLDTYTAKDIERSGSTTTEQFIGKLTQNSATISPLGGVTEREGGTGIDLRGLGVGTTLVLVNGRRMSLAAQGRAPDISMIPLSAIERVEVLTDGASAIYGSDAIGGVVNFVLRKDFDGADTRLSHGGVTSGGMRQTNFTQTVGANWTSGNGLISYDYLNASALERADRDYSRALAPGFLTPDDERHNLFATFSQELTDSLIVNGDIVLGRRDVESRWSFRGVGLPPADFQLRTDSTGETQSLINLGVDYELTESLNASFIASYAETETDRRSITTFFNDPSRTPLSERVANHHTGLDITAMLDGALFELPGGEVRFSIGAGILDEDFSGQNDFQVVTGSEIGRKTTYAFAEVLAPLIGPEQDVPFINRLEVSLAGRYTDTEDTSRPSISRDFGSATDPKVGLLWAPISALSLRGTYGTSFRAPLLPQLDPIGSSSGLLIGNFPLPFPTGTPSTVLLLSGVSPDIDAETAETYTLGFDFRLHSNPGFKLSATYYAIDYTDRIQVPDFGAVPLFTPTDFPELFTRQPSAAIVENHLTQSPVTTNLTSIDLSNIAAAAALLGADPNFWLYDLRARNLALSQQDGLDVSISDYFDVSWGQVRYGANVTTIFDYQQAPLAGRPSITVVDRAHAVVDLRARAYVGLSHDGFDGTVSVNYADDYINLGDPSGRTAVDSWTTVDLNLSYDFTTEGGSGFFNGFRANLSAQNLFDQDPPFMVSIGSDARYGFDPQNASPLGRLLTIGFAKSW